MLKKTCINIISNKKNTLLFLTVFFFFVQFLLFLHFGIVTENEAAKYIRQGTLLYETGGFSDTKYIFYLPVILLVYLCKVLGVGYWLVVLVQVLLAWLAMICFYQLATKITNNQLGFFGTLMLICFFPLQSWNFHLYTDSIFISLVTMYLYVIFSQNNKGLKGNLIIMFFLALLLFVRPNAVLLIPPTIVYFLLKKQSKKSRAINAFLSIFILFIFFAVSNYAFKGGGDLDTLKPFIEEHIICFAPTKPEGATLNIVRTNSPIYDLSYYILHNKIHFTKLMFLKLFSFFKMTRPYYSTAHNMMLLAIVLPLYTLAIAGIGKPLFKNNFYIFLISFLVLYPIGISLQCDDWHSRFTMAVIPGIILLALLGIKNFYKLITKRKSFT